jgi:SecD/SecF fusion protein
MTDRRRSLFVLLLVAGLIAASAVAIATKPTRLGLDLQGGVSLVYQARATAQSPVNPESMQRSIDLMRQRVDALGVSEPEIRQSGNNQIEVNLPGVADAERAARQVGSTAQLFFYDWEANVLDQDCRTHPDEVNGGQQAILGLYTAVQRAAKCPPQRDANNQAAAQPRFYVFDRDNRPLAGGQTFQTRQAALEAIPAAQRASAKVLEVPVGILVLRDEQQPQETRPPDRWWVIQDNPGLSGRDIRNPEQNFDQQSANQPIVTFQFSDKGRRAFQDITARVAARGQDNAPPGANPIAASQHFAIALDNALVSTPYINYQENPDGIDGANGAQISGGFTIQTAQDLAQILKIGALPLRLDLISRSQVSATLGAQALDQGLAAGIAGFVIVALFLVAYYRVLGLIAAGGLVVYAIYLFALVKLIPVTLTLPGIAGLILTIGVAADANIVIFERVKEEIRAGRSTGAAIVSGYRKGLTAIVDANVVTLLVAFILFILATAGVRGFAFTLGLGVIVSLFTAVLATQAILYSLRSTRVIRSRAALGAGERRFSFRFDYMGASKWFFSMSGVILLIGALAIAGKGINFGIDFESGTRITAPLERAASVNDVRSALQAQGLGDAEIQTLQNRDLGQHVVQISTGSLGPDQVDRVERTLDRSFGLADQPSLDSIGPTFGQTVANSALIAIIASLAVISIYIALRFEWKFAVPVLIALMHDVLITSGVYALTGREVTTSTVAALLTILGYSLYDTIIVFDRVRENAPRMPSATFSQIVNRSMSEVIVRSVATSFSTLLPVLALFLFGGETLKDFAFALIVGIASGTYSSVFIASPVLSHWKQREPVYQARERRLLSELGQVPAYAVAVGGRPADVAPRDAERGRPTPAGAVPGQPGEVSRAEWNEMVANLGVDEAREREREPAAAAGGRRPAGGRRARARADGNGPQGPRPKPEPRAGGEQPGARAAGEAPPPERKSRNRRHGRPR